MATAVCENELVFGGEYPFVAVAASVATAAVVFGKELIFWGEYPLMAVAVPVTAAAVVCEAELSFCEEFSLMAVAISAAAVVCEEEPAFCEELPLMAIAVSVAAVDCKEAPPFCEKLPLGDLRCGWVGDGDLKRGCVTVTSAKSAWSEVACLCIKLLATEPDLFAVAAPDASAAPHKCTCEAVTVDTFTCEETPDGVLLRLADLATPLAHRTMDELFALATLLDRPTVLCGDVERTFDKLWFESCHMFWGCIPNLITGGPCGVEIPDGGATWLHESTRLAI
jgi:hypothetical protein